MLPPRARDLAIILVSVAALAGPKGLAAAPWVAPVDTRAAWTVGITAFRSDGLAAEDAWLGWSVPLLLRDAVAGLGSHLLGTDGRVAVARAAIARERRALLTRLEALRKARDDAELAGAGPAPAAAAAAAGPNTGTAAPAETLAEATEHLAWLDRLDPWAVSVADTKPIAFKEGQEAGSLLATPFGSRAEAAGREDVDLLVGGSVQEASGYFVIEVWAWDAARQAEVFTWRDAAVRTEVYERVAEAAQALTGVLLGRPWAGLAVTTTPVGATVLVDGHPAGPGRTRFGDLAPGSHEVRASAPGYRDEVREVELAPGTETTLAISLSAIDLGTIALTSDPPGADAWLDAVWQGRTPLDIPRPAEREHLVLSLPQGPETSLTVGPGTPDRLSISLSEAALHSDERQKQARDRFYGSFGWLVLSLPVPFYTYSWAYDWAAEANRLTREGDITGAGRAARIGYGYYYAYLGGLAVSAGLAGWAVYNLVRYIKAADRPALPGQQP